MAPKQQRREVSSRVTTFADIPDGVFDEILAKVSLKSGGFSHALVSRKWRDFATPTLVALKASCKSWRPTEEEIADEMKAFQNITKLTVTSAFKLSDSFLESVASHCPNLRKLKVREVGRNLPCKFTPEGWGPLFRACSRLTSLDLRLPSAADHWFPGDFQGLVALTDLKLHVVTTELEEDMFVFPSSLTRLELTMEVDWDDVFDTPGSLPEGIWELPNLRKLHLIVSQYAEFVVDIPPAISQLSKLTDLAIELPWGTESLPNELAHLSSLCSLSITCPTIASLPSSLGTLNHVTALYLDCIHLSELPPTISTWTQLRDLRLHCGELRNTSERLSMLQPGSLRLTVYDALVPKLSRQLQESIRTLTLWSPHIPRAEDGDDGHRRGDEDGQSREGADPSQLPSLGALELSPLQVESLPALDRLTLRDFKVLSTGFSICPSLKVLHFARCHIEKSPDSIHHLTALRELSIGNCFYLQGLPPSAGQLSALTSLAISNCHSFADLPDTVGNLPNLQELKIGASENFKDFPASIGQLEKLTALHLWSLPNLSAMPLQFSRSSPLQVLSVERCKLLDSLPESLGNLYQLRTLCIRSCSRMDSLPGSFQGLLSLRSLSLKGLQRLETLPAGMSRLTGLRDLTLSGLVVRALPQGLSCLTGLRFLSIKAWDALEALPPGLVDALPLLNEGSQTRLRTLEEGLQRAATGDIEG